MCVEPDGFAAASSDYIGQLFSVGVHPWSLRDASPVEVGQLLELLDRVAEAPCVAAIGESGLDALCGAPIELQREVLERHVELSERVCKPLVLHVVRTGHEIMALRKRLGRVVSQPWVWHGFRGNAVQMGQWCAFPGTYVSLGARFNRDAAAAVPADRLLLETDDAEDSIADVTRRVAEARGVAAEVLVRQVAANAERVFGSCGRC